MRNITIGQAAGNQLAEVMAELIAERDYLNMMRCIAASLSMVREDALRGSEFYIRRSDGAG